MDVRRLILAAVVMASLLAACGAPPSASVAPLTEAKAIQLVLGQDARFAGIGPADPDLIGQAAWYEVAATQNGWQVQVRIGWGDCPAGCINQHRWVYAVTREGDVSLVSEEGDPPPVASGVRGIAVAGPTCPVVTVPADPACADRPVEGAVIVALDDAGIEVARVTTGPDGAFSIGLAPGSYRIVPQPVEGLTGTATAQGVGIAAGEPMAELTFSYDTGIR